MITLITMHRHTVLDLNRKSFALTQESGAPALLSTRVLGINSADSDPASHTPLFRLQGRRLCLILIVFSVILLRPAAHAQTSLAVAGITEPYLDVTLSAPSNGTFRTQFFKEGDFVRQGQIILELDKRLEELTVERRKLVVDTLKTDLEGTRRLYEATKSVSKDDLQKKELEFKVAVVDYELANEQLHRRLLAAPFEGTIVEFFLHLGEDCKAQEPLVRLVDTRRCYFVAHVEAKSGFTLQPGQKAALEIEAGAGIEKVEGSVTFVSPVVDPASGLFEVKILFANPDGKIRPGVPGKLQLSKNS